MKKRNSILLAVEIALLIIFCTLIVYSAFKMIYTKYDEEMQEALIDMESLLKAITDRNTNLNENFEKYRNSYVATGVFYLEELNGHDISEETLNSLKDDMQIQLDSLITTDFGRTVKVSTTDAYIPDFSDPYFDPLFEVSPDNPLSDQVYMTREYFQQKLAEADSQNQTGSSLQDESAGEKQDESADNEQDTSNSDDQDDSDDDDQDQSDPETASESDPDPASNTNPETEDSSMSGDADEFDDLASIVLNLGNSYISCYYDDDQIVIFEFAYTVSSKDELDYSSYINILEGRRFGTNGFYMLIDPLYGRFYLYPPAQDEFNPVHLDDLNLPNSLLKDGFSRILNLSGKLYYCRSRYMKDLKLTLSCAVPVSEINYSVFAVLLGPMLSFLLGVFVMRNYVRLLLFNAIGAHNYHEKNRVLIQKLAIALGLSILVTVLITVYSFFLYMYTDQIKANVQKSMLMENALDSMEGEEKYYGTYDYDNYVAGITITAADLLGKSSDMLTLEKLRHLGDLGHFFHILVYDSNGVVIASDSNYSGLRLPTDKESLAGEFYWVLHGDPLLIQHEVDEDYLHSKCYYSGAPIRDENGNYTGMVLLAFSPLIWEDLTYTLTVDTILENFSESRGSFVFVVDMDDHKVYSTDPELDKKSVDMIGLTENEMADGYIGFLKLRQYYLLGCCQACKKYFAYVVSHVNMIPLKAFHYSLHFLFVVAGGEILFFLVLVLYAISCHSLSEAEVKEFFRHRQKDAVVAEEKLLLFLKRTVFLLCFVVTLTMIFRHYLFSHDSLGYYIFTLEWGKGVYIFTITRCLIYIMTAGFTLALFTRILTLLGKLVPSKQETIIRMFLSFLKYALVIVAVFLCLTTLGAPTTSILGAAGVLTIMISMGAQSLVADILSGFFIIFEGTYKVGDMITVDDWHGQVMEIGIRNTKIRDLISSDVKIMNNSTIKNVINFSVYPSFAAIQIGIEYGVDLHKLEEIIEREKPVIKKNIPFMIGELMYLGVDDFADSAVILKFQVACRNQDYLKAKRALNREIKLMFDRNGINVPFPQIVLNTRTKEESINNSASKLRYPDEKSGDKVD